MTPAQVADMMSVTVAEVIDLVVAGDLRGTQLGTPPQWRIVEASVQEYLDEQLEHARRTALWRESSTASFPEIWGGGRRSRS